MRAQYRLLELTSAVVLTGLLFSPVLAQTPQTQASPGSGSEFGQALGAAGQAIGGNAGQALGAAGKAFGGTGAPAGAGTANQATPAPSQPMGATTGQPSTATADKPANDRMARDNTGNTAA